MNSLSDRNTTAMAVNVLVERASAYRKPKAGCAAAWKRCQTTTLRMPTRNPNEGNDNEAEMTRGPLLEPLCILYLY